MVSIGCENLQIGVNSIPVNLYENSEALESVADAFKNTAITEWNFFEDAIGEPAIYTFDLEVAEECTKEPLTTREDMDGRLVVFERNKA